MVINKVEDKGKVRVFVYGTLKMGQVNNPLMSKSKADFLGYDTITGNFKLYDMGGCPALTHAEVDNNQTSIKGQIFVVDNEGLASLDLFEGHPNFYIREKLVTDRLEKRVWVYFMDHKEVYDGADVCSDGIWNPTDGELAVWEKQSTEKENTQDGSQN